MKANILRVLSIRLAVEMLKKSSTCVNLNIIKILPAATVGFSKWNLYVTVDCIVDRNTVLIYFEVFYSIQGIERYNKHIHANKKELNSIRFINRCKKTTTWKQCQIGRCYQYLLSHSGNVKGRSYNRTLEFTFLGLLTELFRNQDSGFKNHAKKDGVYFLAAFYCHFAEKHFHASVTMRNRIISPKFKLSFLS